MFTVFNVDGNVKKSGSCQIIDYDLQNSPNEIIVEGIFAGSKYYYADGEVTSYTPDQVSLKSNRPDSAISWSNTLMQWEIYEPIISLADAALAKWEQMKLLRTTSELKPFTCDGATYDSNKEQIMGAVQLATLAQLAGQPFSIDWTLKDNSTKTLNASAMIAVGIALGKHVAAIYDQGRVIRDRIAAATTVEAINAIEWPTS